MVESLIAGKASLVNIEDRTQVINLKEWNVTPDDILHIYDHGGHFIYSIIAPLFISRHSLLFIVHDVTKVHPEHIRKITEVLCRVLHQYPDNSLYIILTHTDLIDAEQVEKNSDAIVGTLKQFLDNEISNLNKLLIEKESMAESQGIVNKTFGLLEKLKERRANLPVFCVSSQNYSGMERVRNLLTNAVKKKRSPIPELWVEFYKQIIGTKKMYLTLNETSKLYQRATNNMPGADGSQAEPGCEFLIPLQYFSDSNLCLHYEDNPFLKDYVFPDIDLLVDLFKSLFHHNLAEVINFDTNAKLQSIFTNYSCDLAVQRYQKEGLLGKKLLLYLWEHYGLSLSYETVLLELMKSFNLCYSISKHEELLHFPWLVQSQQCPPHIVRDNLMKFDTQHASVHLQCKFFNRIPLNVFEMISVCLQRKATQDFHYMGDRQAWCDGLEIRFGSVLCVLIRSEHHSTIDICLYGNIDDMPQVWKTMDSLLQDLQSILKPFSGVIQSIHFVCGHCVILGILTPKLWIPDFVFPKKSVKVSRYVNCPMDSSVKIPAALLIHVFKGKYYMLYAYPAIHPSKVLENIG